MKNAIKRIIIAELTQQSPNSKEIYKGLIKQYPEYADDIKRLANAMNIDLEDNKYKKEVEYGYQDNRSGT